MTRANPTTTDGDGPIRPFLAEAPKPVVLRMHPELAARAHAWAEATIGKMSASAAVACAVREALPLLEKRGTLHNYPEVIFANSGCLVGPGRELDEEDAEAE